ncbi:hypothetical protein C8034_v004616 [Colletotrichum sidae]|uniref:CENP-V/GFA domain-containing protein n=1 Tax=Colletotrichum sidae TaxID=1347389 RepID=A0A4R8TSQ7_9PEZI|nr:hypothetical protein C8034_v004616 [Colletotrichum sidae]
MSAEESSVTTGACSCGDIKYTFKGDALLTGLCHCLNCKRASSNSFAANVIIPGETFEITSGKPTVYASNGGSGKETRLHFCGRCSSQIYAVSDVVPAFVFVKPGTFDDWELAQTKFKPKVEVWCARRLAWQAPVEGAASFDGNAPSEA